MSCRKCGRRARGQLCRDCEREEQFTERRRLDDADRFPHHCDICDTPFQTFRELTTHDCATNAVQARTDGGQSTEQTYHDVCPECGSDGDHVGEMVSGGLTVGHGAPNYTEVWQCPDCDEEWTA